MSQHADDPELVAAREMVKAQQRYRAAAHAMQSGVLTLLEVGQLPEASAKHTRVGINSAMVDSAALADLLIRKGIITPLEHMQSLADVMEREAESYRVRCEKTLGVQVTLG